MFHYACQRILLEKNNSVKHMQSSLELQKISEHRHERACCQSGEGHIVDCKELFKLMLFIVQPHLDLVCQAVEHLQRWVVHLSKITLFTHQLYQNNKSRYLIKVDTYQNHSSEKIHALTVTNIWNKLGISSKHIKQCVLFAFDRPEELINLFFCEGTWHIYRDLPLRLYIFKIARIKIEHLIFESIIKIFITLFN